MHHWRSQWLDTGLGRFGIARCGLDWIGCLISAHTHTHTNAMSAYSSTLCRLPDGPDSHGTVRPPLPFAV
jgi:hypothetical protein